MLIKDLIELSLSFRAEKEFKKKRELARKLRKQIEQSGGQDEEGEGEGNDNKLNDTSNDIESLSSEEQAKCDEDEKNFKDAQRVEKKGATKRMEAGRQLSPKYAADFQKHLVGIPLIDIDPFYKEKEVSGFI